jgi:hypothetical protein
MGALMRPVGDGYGDGDGNGNGYGDGYGTVSLARTGRRR